MADAPEKPGFTIVAALALALGIGANSAIFSIINAIVLKPLPFDDLDRIVAVWEKAPGRALSETKLRSPITSTGASRTIRSRTWRSTCCGAQPRSIDPPERVRGYQVSPNLLDVVE